MLKKSSSLGFQNSLPYNNSKLANSLFMMELSRRLQGTEVNTYSLCPGLVSTEVFRNFTPIRKFYTRVNILFAGLTPEQVSHTLNCKKIGDNLIYLSNMHSKSSGM